jgi:hypothetical protein
VKNTLRHLYRSGRRAAAVALFPLLRPRRLDVCCCGLSKTGTHSIAGLFENYRSAHHPDAELRLRLATDYLKGEVDAARVQRILRRRDRWLWLELESSSLAGILIEPFVTACPKKKFILTIRDVYSWCDSWIDNNINRPLSESSPFAVLDRVRLRVEDFTPTKHDSPLIERGGLPLPCYFQLWAKHNTQVLQAVPRAQLFVVKTQQITDRVPDIAAWVGVPPRTLRADRAWLFAAPKKHRVLAALDPSYVHETAERYCGTLMRQYFPEASSKVSNRCGL